LPQAVLADFSTALTTVLESLKALQPAGTLAGAEPDVELSPLPRDAAAEIARRLRDAAAAGDVTELAAIAAELETRHDMGRCYGEELQRLTDEFDFDKILILAETMEK
jgi:HPt (histidine-containing phosphotransfer) domain-containing protein